MSQTLSIRAEFPEKLAPLFKPARYKVLHGGRASMKSWGIARALLILGTQRPLRILCVRELQASLDDSVHKLLSDQIDALGFGSIYRVEKAAIYGPGGTEFAFEGIRHNVQKIKSYEGIDICWVEEAQGVSKNSWEVLIPTIRKSGSEIWVSFNPFREKDNTYQRFIVNPPEGATVVKLNWRDNPWLSAEMLQEIEHMRQTDPDGYLNVWEGHCVSNLEGAIYARELREAKLAGRVCNVPWTKDLDVQAYFDLGRRDYTCIWFVQRVMAEYRVIEYHEERGHDFSHYIRLLQRKPYLFGYIGLPHDAKLKLLAARLSIEGQLREHKFATKVAPRAPVITGISAVRSIFQNCYFDEKACAKGLERLGDYRFDVEDDDAKTFSINPLHDDASHGADAFRTFAMVEKVFAKRRSGQVSDAQAPDPALAGWRKAVPKFFSSGSSGWMGR